MRRPEPICRDSHGNSQPKQPGRLREFGPPISVSDPDYPPRVLAIYHVQAGNIELWVSEGRIRFTPQDDAETLSGAFAIAGLVDCHSHSTFDLSNRGLPAGSRAVVEANMRDYFAAGVTAIRDAGGLSMAAVEALSPRLIAAGRFLAPPGRYFTDWTLPTEAGHLVEAARAQIQAGAAWVKIVDDWFSPTTGRVEQHYEPSTVAEVVVAAHAAGARVAMHCMDTASVDAALDSGVDSIEHGCNIQASQIERMAAAGTAWCPTVTLISGFMSRQLPDPDYKVRVRRFYSEELKELLPQAAALGITILAGSDTIPPADFWQEIATLQRYGLDPDTALASATTAARAYLGLPDLDDGAPADVVLYEADPRNDPEILQRPSLVMVAGEIVATG
jgi:imidazolonepropionase-like amidohydrolase